MKKITLIILICVYFSSFCNAQDQEELKLANGFTHFTGLSPIYILIFETSEGKIVTIVPHAIRKVIYNSGAPTLYYVEDLPIFLGKTLCFNADVYIGNNENVALMKEVGFISIDSGSMKRSENGNTFSYRLAIMIGDPVIDIGKIIANGINNDGDIELKVFLNSMLLKENIVKATVVDRRKMQSTP